MTAKHATGYIETWQSKDGPIYRAKMKLPDGRQPRRRLGKAWTKKSRPPEGYVTRREAEVMLADMLAGRDPSLRVEPVTLTWGQLCDSWLATREIEMSTRADYSNAIKARIKPMLGADTPVDEIDVDQLGRFRDDLLVAGLAPRTISKYLALIHSIFRYGAEAHGLKFNPAAAVRRPRQRKRELKQYLTAEEVGVLVRAAETDEEAALYEVACWTGLRWGELVALRWSDIDWLGSQLQVSRSKPVKGVEKAPKSGKPRPVPLWDPAAQALERLSHRGFQVADDDYVFTDPAGDPVMDYDRVAIRRFKAARERAGLTSPRPGSGELTFHSLRHTYATIAARIYGNLREVQEYMGHSTIAMTEIYAKFVPRLDAAQRGSAGLAALLAETPELVA